MYAVCNKLSIIKQRKNMLKYLFLLSLLFENVFGMDESLSLKITNMITESGVSAHAARGLYYMLAAQESHLPVELISRRITGDECFGMPILNAQKGHIKHLFEQVDCKKHILKNMTKQDLLDNCHNDFKVAIRSNRRVFFGCQLQEICRKSSDYQVICMHEYILKSQPSYYKSSSL
jgi:macrodomain Ter protein organizer (MatP/YcbG family)